ncbi:MAG: anhydro-N-acetylmuramic acid kinase [Bacteroidetes bacterium]|nr:MAG: anhydro-N-acetylmuramic acid kinase [Bacteroidota bacterium]
MVYKVIGVMSGSSMDGLDIVYVHFQETTGKWRYEIIQTACYEFTADWIDRLAKSTELSAKDYLILHAEFGHYIGSQVNRFISEYGLQYQIQLITSHGHTSFHLPHKKMTAQLGDGAAIAASTGINVICDLRSIDVALGGQGAPIVPIGEKLLLDDFDFFLNLGGIANISCHVNSNQVSNENKSPFIAFDVCPANRVLNMLAGESGKKFDKDGLMAEKGMIHYELLEELDLLEYYSLPYPKSLANDFGTEVIYPLIQKKSLSTGDALRTYVEHICEQIKRAAARLDRELNTSVNSGGSKRKMFVTGGGAHNLFLIQRLKEALSPVGIELIVPGNQLIDFKEALTMGLIGVLRWREEINVLSSVTGALRSSIGGSVWIGQE